MDTLPRKIVRWDAKVADWMARHGVFLLRISVGVVFLWFGIVKFVPGLSPADEIATLTFSKLTLGRIGPEISRPLLATWEVAIGLGLLTRIWLRLTILLMLIQLAGAMTPLVILQERTWKHPYYVLTIEGQYIVKDIVLLAAGLVIGATVRGGFVAGEIKPRARDHPF